MWVKKKKGSFSLCIVFIKIKIFFDISEAESVFVNKREKAGKEECDVLFFHHFSKAPQGKCIHHLPFNSVKERAERQSHELIAVFCAHFII